MSRIFQEPPAPDFGPLKVLFLHGLEGSTNGRKATLLKNQWGAVAPNLRTEKLRQIKADLGPSGWRGVSDRKLKNAIEDPYSDAKDAVRYLNPDIIVGSSMGGALLFKLVLEEVVDATSTTCVFLAPAIEELVNPQNTPLMPGSIWVLGEMDDVVNNKANIKYSQLAGGSLIFSERDNHSLSLSTGSGLLSSVMTTAFEINNFYSVQQS